MMRPRMLERGRGPNDRLSTTWGGSSSSLSATTQQCPSGILNASACSNLSRH